MGLRSALVDRARIIRPHGTATKVEGSTVFTTVVGPWFRVRLEPALAQEGTAPGDFKTVTKSPVILMDTVDENGAPVGLTNEDRLEINAPRFGPNQIWLVIQDPEPIAKKRRVIGYQVQLQRVEKHLAA